MENKSRNNAALPTQFQHGAVRVWCLQQHKTKNTISLIDRWTKEGETTLKTRTEPLIVPLHVGKRSEKKTTLKHYPNINVQ